MEKQNVQAKEVYSSLSHGIHSSSEIRFILHLLYLSLQAVVYMLKNIVSCNVGAIITGVLSLVILIGLKKVNERFKSKMKVPIPAELLVVMFLFIHLP